MDSNELMEMADRYGAHNYKPLPVVIDRAEGVYMFDCEGKRYLDFLACYSALNQGHGHPRIVEAARRQLGRLTLTSRAFHNAEMGPFLKEICEYTGAEMALPMNTGAEAVETVIKAARKWAYRIKGVPRDQAEIVVCADNFHGRTVTAVSFSTETLYREDFGPYTPGFKVIPFGDAGALEDAITSCTAAFLVEPIQGEAGVNIPPDGYLAAVREITRSHDVLLIADEIQTGFGRTGRRFCCDHEGVKPDLMSLGKALGGGVYPVSAAVGRADVLGLFRPGEHGSTFGGNPLACAVARESLKVLEEERLHERSATLGAAFLEALRAVPHPLVKEVRGRGLFIGMELLPEAGGARRYCEALMERGLLCKETHDNVIRFAPPLIIEPEQLDWALDQVRDVLSEI
ncbi:MAG: ornithine--oxo-acid transaminase [Deltaproteobacteria bacterium]|nr:ornithine--oxo-acid transaminase [Deltaproteobacteria bacterium]